MRSAHSDADLSAREYGEYAPRTQPGWAPKQLQDLLDEVATPLTLSERMENWGSD
jgi:hypothetical protein